MEFYKKNELRRKVVQRTFRNQKKVQVLLFLQSNSSEKIITYKIWTRPFLIRVHANLFM